MDRMPLSVPKLDDILGGGIECGIVTNVFGESGSGKTAFAMQALKSCLMAGKKAIYIDTEGGFSVERFSQMCGKDKLGMVILVEPKDFDQQDNIINFLEEKIEEEKIGLVIIDSVVALYRLDSPENGRGRANQMLGRQLAKLSRTAKNMNIPILVTNHVYTGFDTGELEIVGGDIPKYWSKCLLRLDKHHRGIRKLVLVKHRSRPENDSAAFVIANEGLVGYEGKIPVLVGNVCQIEGETQQQGYFPEFVTADEVK